MQKFQEALDGGSTRDEAIEQVSSMPGVEEDMLDYLRTRADRD
jgi:hypothetical protein